MTIPGLQIGAFGCRFAKNCCLMIEFILGKFIVNLHQISILDAMERSNLALDAPKFCRFSRFGLRCRSNYSLEWLVTIIFPSSDTM